MKKRWILAALMVLMMAIPVVGMADEQEEHTHIWGGGNLPRMNIFTIAQYAISLTAVPTAEVMLQIAPIKENVQFAVHFIMMLISTIGVTGLTLVTEKHTAEHAAMVHIMTMYLMTIMIKQRAILSSTVVFAKLIIKTQINTKVRPR